MIRAHAGRRHARAVPVAPVKPMRKMLADAWFWSAAPASVIGLTYWAITRWPHLAFSEHAWITPASITIFLP